jgi:hypothetical protein
MWVLVDWGGGTTLARPVLTKFLFGDYLTYQVSYDATKSGTTMCKKIIKENKTTFHVIPMSPAYDATRTRILNEIKEVACLLVLNLFSSQS